MEKHFLHTTYFVKLSFFKPIFFHNRYTEPGKTVAKLENMKDSFPIRQKNVLKNERRLSITQSGSMKMACQVHMNIQNHIKSVPNFMFGFETFTSLLSFLSKSS